MGDMFLACSFVHELWNNAQLVLIVVSVSHVFSGNLNSVDYFWDGVKLVMQPTNLLDPYDGVTLDHNL